jgi:hypothetical protein
VRFRGWVFRDPETDVGVIYDDDRLESAGAVVVRVAGVSYRRDVLQRETFRPGQPIRLVPEPENCTDPNAVAICDAGLSHVGYVPKEFASDIASRLGIGEQLQAMCLAEFVYPSGERCALRVLIAPRSFNIELEDPA